MDDRRCILVAGVGNVFYADDGFGVEVAQRMHLHDWPPQVRIADFGIRGIDLAYALLDGEYSLAILADLLPGNEPGQVRVLQPKLDESDAAPQPSLAEAHMLDPLSVLQALRGMGQLPELRVVGCAPARLEDEMGLSEPVQRAVDEAMKVIRSLIMQHLDVEPVGCMSLASRRRS